MIGCKIERRLAYPVGVLFELVTDIKAYPLYMPGWCAVRVLTRTPGRVVVEQIVSLGGVHVRFLSTADADPPRRLVIRANGAPFRQFRLLWRFTAEGPAETVVQAGLEIAFRSRTFERFAAPMMPIMLRRIIAAFERRAAQRYRVAEAERASPDRPADNALTRLGESHERMNCSTATGDVMAGHHPSVRRPGEPCSDLARKKVAECEEQSGRDMHQDGQRIHREQCEGQPATVLGRVLPARDPLPATTLGDEKDGKRQ